VSTQPPIFVGNSPASFLDKTPAGHYVRLAKEQFYKISDYDAMPPFSMVLVSASDHWLFISSTGGVTAGRRNADSALFPYYTEDRISENHEQTGCKCILLAEKDGKRFLWEPFSCRNDGCWRRTRNLYKNMPGTTIIFEEINHDLDLTMRYAWRASERFGFVNTSWLRNDGGSAVRIDALSGLQNLLPSGVSAQAQNDFSVLLDAYKRAGLDETSGLATFSMSSMLSDLAEPGESLKTTTVWQRGLDKALYLLSSRQLDAFRHAAAPTVETDVRGMRCAFFARSTFALEPGSEKTWHLIADVDQDHAQVAALLRELLSGTPRGIVRQVDDDIEAGKVELLRTMAGADALQQTADTLSASRHFANVLFNAMRGGIFANGYAVETRDLISFLRARNRKVCRDRDGFLQSLPAQCSIDELLSLAAVSGCADLERLSYEYLPLSFSRRHGDPSRPWNTFSINLKNPDGYRRLDFQGNWRDIFQNWEPLAFSYPAFIESMIAKFVNATTADGYNPYRISRDGIAWDAPDPKHPWANIGYWGDHQIIYVLRLMEASARFHPGKLRHLLEKRIFSHAQVPYRIRPYRDLVRDWYHTIEFDYGLNETIGDRVERMGTDGRLVLDDRGNVAHVTLTEKLLILVLTKLSNLVPGGGIWMNTQRPEWNDANNALAGKGLSVVTVCYLRRFCEFCESLFAGVEIDRFSISASVHMFLRAIFEALSSGRHLLATGFSDRERRALMDHLGEAGDAYRQGCYRQSTNQRLETVEGEEIVELLRVSRDYAEHTIRASVRSDGLYEAYNTLQFGSGTASVNPLYEMLEGQVAVLSSGVLTGEESVALIERLRTSALYRPDQHSYMLQPNRALPGFLEKNRVPAERVSSLGLVKALAENDDTSLLARDVDGVFHFHASFRNELQLRDALETLRAQPKYGPLVESDGDAICALYEEIFDHRSFTGRAGTFFAYEGLGSVYWHMVSKLLLAVQERVFEAKAHGDRPETVHTPAGRGAQQPGMTGAVKEEVLTRLGEVGLRIDGGAMVFDPLLVRRQEFLAEPQPFEYFDTFGRQQRVDLQPGTFAFTLCQVPIVVGTGDEGGVRVTRDDGSVTRAVDSRLDAGTSARVFGRDGSVRRIDVSFREVDCRR
jgi:hypothetical protein